MASAVNTGENVNQTGPPLAAVSPVEAAAARSELVRHHSSATASALFNCDLLKRFHEDEAARVDPEKARRHSSAAAAASSHCDILKRFLESQASLVVALEAVAGDQGRGTQSISAERRSAPSSAGDDHEDVAATDGTNVVTKHPQGAAGELAYAENACRSGKEDEEHEDDDEEEEDCVVVGATAALWSPTGLPTARLARPRITLGPSPPVAPGPLLEQSSGAATCVLSDVDYADTSSDDGGGHAQCVLAEKKPLERVLNDSDHDDDCSSDGGSTGDTSHDSGNGRASSHAFRDAAALISGTGPAVPAATVPATVIPAVSVPVASASCGTKRAKVANSTTTQGWVPKHALLQSQGTISSSPSSSSSSSSSSSARPSSSSSSPPTVLLAPVAPAPAPAPVSPRKARVLLADIDAVKEAALQAFAAASPRPLSVAEAMGRPQVAAALARAYGNADGGARARRLGRTVLENFCANAHDDRLREVPADPAHRPDGALRVWWFDPLGLNRTPTIAKEGTVVRATQVATGRACLLLGAASAYDLAKALVRAARSGGGGGSRGGGGGRVGSMPQEKSIVSGVHACLRQNSGRREVFGVKWDVVAEGDSSTSSPSSAPPPMLTWEAAFALFTSGVGPDTAPHGAALPRRSVGGQGSGAVASSSSAAPSASAAAALGWICV